MLKFCGHLAYPCPIVDALINCRRYVVNKVKTTHYINYIALKFSKFFNQIYMGVSKILSIHFYMNRIDFVTSLTI